MKNDELIEGLNITKQKLNDIFSGKNKNALRFADYVDNYTLIFVLNKNKIRWAEICKDVIILEDITDEQVREIRNELNENKWKY